MVADILAKIQKIVYVVGNNFSDDIVLARKIKSKAVYVGHSLIRQLFKPTYYVRDFDEALSLLLE